MDMLLSVKELSAPATGSVNGYVAYQYSYGSTCNGDKTFSTGYVAGECINGNTTSYQIIMQDGK